MSELDTNEIEYNSGKYRVLFRFQFYVNLFQAVQPPFASHSYVKLEQIQQQTRLTRPEQTSYRPGVWLRNILEKVSIWLLDFFRNTKRCSLKVRLDPTTKECAQIARRNIASHRKIVRIARILAAPLPKSRKIRR